MEAAGQTLGTQRLKGAGLAWPMAGGPALLPLRSLLQSGRGAQAWPLLAADFRFPVEIPDNTTAAPFLLAAYNSAVWTRKLLNSRDAPVCYVAPSLQLVDVVSG